MSSIKFFPLRLTPSYKVVPLALLILLHSERPKTLCSFGLPECNRVKVKVIINI